MGEEGENGSRGRQFKQNKNNQVLVCCWQTYSLTGKGAKQIRAGLTVPQKIRKTSHIKESLPLVFLLLKQALATTQWKSISTTRLLQIIAPGGTNSLVHRVADT